MTSQPSQRSPAPAPQCKAKKWDAGNPFNRAPHCCSLTHGHKGSHRCAEDNGTPSGCGFTWANDRAPEPVPALCPECGREGFRTNANGVQECRSMACINFPYITSLNRAKWEARRAVSSDRSSNESQSPEPLVAESVTKGSPSTVQPLEVMPSADAQRDSRVVAVSVASPADAKGSVSAGDNDLLNDADAMVKRADALGWRGTAAMVRSLASALREARTLCNRWMKAALTMTPPSGGAIAFDPTHPEGYADACIRATLAIIDERDGLRAELREAREQLAQARSALEIAVRAGNELGLQLDEANARFEDARRAVEQLPPLAVVKLPSSPHCRDALDRSAVLEILSSPPQQSVSPESAKGA